MPRHGIEVVDPELALPDFRDIGLGRVRAVSVARRAQIERDVEFDASLLNVRFVIRVLDRIKSLRADYFGNVEAPIHGTHLIRSAHGDHPAVVPILHPDAIALCRRVFALVDGDCDSGCQGVFAEGQPFCGCLPADFGGGEFAGFTGGGVATKIEAGRKTGRREHQQQDGNS